MRKEKYKNEGDSQRNISKVHLFTYANGIFRFYSSRGTGLLSAPEQAVMAVIPEFLRLIHLNDGLCPLREEL